MSLVTSPATIYTGRMGYGLIVLLGSIGLVGAYIFVTETPVWTKVLVAALLGVSFMWRYGFYLQVVLSISLSLYFTYLKSRD